MIVRAIDSPSPVPCGLVVKNVSKTSFSLSFGMPVPESATDTSASASPTNAVSNVILREPGTQFSMASMPFMARFKMTCCRCTSSARTGKRGRRLTDAQHDAPARRLGIEKVERAREPRH